MLSSAAVSDGLLVEIGCIESRTRISRTLFLTLINLLLKQFGILAL